jgi:hypothetical protein
MKSGLPASLFAISLLMLGGCVTPPPLAPTAVHETVKPSSAPCHADGLTRRVLVTAFPLQRPEQIRHGEYMGWPQATAEVLAATLTRGGRLGAVGAPERFPFATADAAPELERDAANMPRLVEWVSRANTQFALAGVFRDFGTARNDFLVPERHMVAEAFLYDGRDGRLLARREFVWKLPLSQGLPRKALPGTREFAATRIGQLHLALIDDMANWAEESLACRPFPLRVTRVEGRRLLLDLGSTHGVAPGMALQDWRPGDPPPARRPGSFPPGARQAFAIVKEASPHGSVAEIPPQRNPPTPLPGDLLYVTPAAARNNP